MRPLALTILAALATAIAMPAPAYAQHEDGDLTHDLEQIERALWHGWAMHDTTPFEKHMVKNSVNIGSWGMQSGKAAILDVIANHNCEVEDVQFSDWQAHKLSDGAAILTYHAMQKGSCDGQELPAKVIVSSAYVWHGDHWMAASYHETELAQ